MPNYKYLIIGGGMTCAAAIGGIREVDDVGAIGVIGAELHRPYDRPPLSKGLWKDKPLESVWRKIDDRGVTFHQGRIARHLDAASKRVTDDQGTIYDYGKLLLATGCTPRRLPFGGDEIKYFRTLDDYAALRKRMEAGERFAVIGGGFIGSEIAAAVAMNAKRAVLIFPDQWIGQRMYPADLAEFITGYYRDKGVELFAETSVTGIEKRDGKSVLKIHSSRTKKDSEIVADGVVAGIGVQPNVELAQAAGLTVDNGIHVDASLVTSDPDIYAAGDVANFYSPALGHRLRVEHEDNANTMGQMAGHSMTGRVVTYEHLPFFYSDLFEMGYEAVGDVDSRLEIVADWKTELKEGVIYYLRDGRVRGLLLWNVFGKVEAARGLIATPEKFSAVNLKGRIPL